MRVNKTCNINYFFSFRNSQIEVARTIVRSTKHMLPPLIIPIWIKLNQITQCANIMVVVIEIIGIIYLDSAVYGDILRPGIVENRWPTVCVDTPIHLANGNCWVTSLSGTNRCILHGFYPLKWTILIKFSKPRIAYACTRCQTINRKAINCEILTETPACDYISRQRHR